MLVGVVLGGIIRVAAEGVGFVLFTWFVVKFVVVLHEFDLPSGCLGPNFLWESPICEVFVVSPYNNR